eukprot:3796167-Lingulodinium_polyedra.AAC.1
MATQGARNRNANGHRGRTTVDPAVAAIASAGSIAGTGTPPSSATPEETLASAKLSTPARARGRTET